MTRFNRILAACLALLFIFASTVAFADVHVKGYTRKNGTYVAPHYRSNPDGNFSNNWSTKGNTNPHTGKPGTRVTPPKSSSGKRPKLGMTVPLARPSDFAEAIAA